MDYIDLILILVLAISSNRWKNKAVQSFQILAFKTYTKNTICPKKNKKKKMEQILKILSLMKLIKIKLLKTEQSILIFYNQINKILSINTMLMVR